jgi:amidase
LDAIIAPSGGPTWLIDHINGDHELGSSYGPAAVAGYAGITVPAGYVDGIPIGLSFFAGRWSEPTLVRLAYAYEQATRQRRPPNYRPVTGT